MSNQPYDPYQQAPQQRQQQGWPGPEQHQQAYDDAQQHTQQWQGRTWETQLQQPIAPAPEETAYLPHPGHQPQQQYGGGYGTGQGHGSGEAYGTAHQPHGTGQQPYGTGQQAYGTGQQAYGTGQQAYDAGQQAYDAGYAQPAREPYQPQPQPQPQPSPEPSAQAVATAPEEPAPAAGAPAYGPATIAGNARITDAQRARLEGRSPIIDPGMQPAALTALLGVLLAVAAPIGSYALLVPLVVLQAVTAAGWFRLNGMWPARQGIALAFLGGLVADAAVLAAGREHGPAAILGTLGVWVLLCLVLQLRSHADPDERMYGLMATVASAALAIVAGGHLAADAHAVSVGAASVAVAVLARALPLPTPASLVVSVLAAAGAGIAVGGMTGLGASGALLGAAAGVCALIGHRVAAYDYPSRFVHFTAGVALPLTAATPAIYILGRALG